jgi:hypothetical protein
VSSIDELKKDGPYENGFILINISMQMAKVYLFNEIHGKTQQVIQIFAFQNVQTDVDRAGAIMGDLLFVQGVITEDCDFTILDASFNFEPYGAVA